MPKLPEMMTSLRVSDNGAVEIIDQLRLPHEVVWEPVKTPEEAFDAIKSMKVSWRVGRRQRYSCCTRPLELSRLRRS